MTINIANNSPRINYTATSGQTVFTVPFEFFDNTDLKVYIEGTLKTITTHYTVFGGNGSTGTVTLVTGATLNDEVTLVRDVPMERTTDLTANYNAASLDGQLDRIVAEIADLDDRVSRTIQINDYELASGLLLPALDSRKGKTIQFNTSTGALEVGPTGADLTAIGSVTSEIATLAGISGNITTVAGSNAQVVAVGNAMTSITAINSALSNVNTVAGGISNINLVGGSISDVNDVADSLGEISAVQAKLTNIDTVAIASANIGTVAGSIAQVNSVASKIADVTGVNTNISAITTANANSTNVNLVANSIDDVNDVGTVITKVTTVADNIGSVNTVAPKVSEISTVSANIGNVNTVATNISSINSATTSAADALASKNAAATSATNAANSATAAATSASSITGAETNSANSATAAATSATAAQTAKTAAETALDEFTDIYLGSKSVAPTVDNDGNALATGSIYWNSGVDQLYIWDGSAWDDAAFTASGAVTSFNTRSGAVTLSSADVTNAAGLLTTGGTMTGDLNVDSGSLKVRSTSGSTLELTNTSTTLGDNAFVGGLAFRNDDTSGSEPHYAGIKARTDGAGGTEMDLEFYANRDKYETDAPHMTLRSTGNLDLTGNLTFADNGKAIFGAGSDLQIYSDGTHGIIKESGSGDLLIYGNNLRLGNADGSELYILGNNNAEVQLRYNNATKLSTTSTGVDVTGTVTSDGLTVDNASPILTLKNSDGTRITTLKNVGTNTELSNSTGGNLRFRTNASELERMRISPDGDISFYEDTGTTAKFFWDASAESLTIGEGNTTQQTLRVTGQHASALSTGFDNQVFKIGNTSASKLSAMDIIATNANGDGATVARIGAFNTSASGFTGEITFSTRNASSMTERMRIDSSGNVAIGSLYNGSSGSMEVSIGSTSSSGGVTLWSPTNSEGGINFGDGYSGTDRYRGSIAYNHSSDHLKFLTASTERMRIDSSGNLLVGTTNTTLWTATSGGGILARPNSSTVIARESTNATQPLLILNETGLDGTLQEFRKDGTSVGSIGSAIKASSRNIYIGSTNTGLYFFDGVDAISPVNPADGGDRDNAIDLGRSNVRFKDLYLSSNVYANNFMGINDTNTFVHMGGSDVMSFFTGNSERMRISSSGNVGIGTSNPIGLLSVVDSSTGSGMELQPEAASNTNRLTNYNRTASAYKNFRLDALQLEFQTSGNERMRIDSSGAVAIGDSNPTRHGITTKALIYNSSTTTGDFALHVGRLTGGAENVVCISNGNGKVGSITTSGSSTAYNTSSDYRLKENVVDLTGASARVNQLDVKRFNWIADDTNTAVDGFLAHEVATVVPEAINGTKDAMRDEEYEVTPAVLDDDGNVTTEAVMGTRSVPDYQGIDQSKLVPLLTAALQEALAKIDAMETRLTALEG